MSSAPGAAHTSTCVRTGAAGKAPPILLLSGHTLRPQDVVVLSEMLEGKRLAAKLRDAARLNADVVLSIQERVDILAVLDEPPPELLPLRGHLLSQLK